MRALRIVFYSAAGLIGMFLLVGVFLPTTAHAERSIATSASPATVISKRAWPS